jgi:hypothetical protein
MMETTHLKLPDNGLVEVLRARVSSHRNQVPPIDVLFLHAALSLCNSRNTLPLQPPCLPFLFGLAAFVGWFGLGARGSRPQS